MRFVIDSNKKNTIFYLFTWFITAYTFSVAHWAITNIAYGIPASAII